MPLTVAIFSILVFVVAQFGTVKQIMRIADRYFNAAEPGQARIWPFRPFTAMERRIAVAMVVFLVVINQAEVAIIVRLSFFNADFFDAIQKGDSRAFWEQLLFVFTPYAFTFVAMTVIEFFVQSMLVIRWRTWLDRQFRVALAVPAQPLSDQPGLRPNRQPRPANFRRYLPLHQRRRRRLQHFLRDLRFLYSADLDGHLAGLVFHRAVGPVVMLSRFRAPMSMLPGFLFWVALIYAAAGTLITHLIGRPLINLYFQRQHMEANFRFSLARLREYTEQVALLNGEGAEKTILKGRFSDLVNNFVDVIFRRMKVTAFTATFGQISPIIPFIFTAPFYFAKQINLGTMTQTAQAFGQVAGALTFFVTYYNYLAGFKSVVDRLTSFDEAIDTAEKLVGVGPAHVAAETGAKDVALDDVDLKLPDGRHIVDIKHLDLASGQSVVVSGPSGTGKSTLFRAIAGIWPYGGAASARRKAPMSWWFHRSRIFPSVRCAPP